MQNFVISIAQIALFEAVLELLLPSGQMKNAVSGGVGVVILYVVVANLVNLILSFI